jgi:hypothetical protein
MSTITLVTLNVTTGDWCPTCEAPTATTKSGIGSRKGSAEARPFALSSCPECERAWELALEPAYPPGHPSVEPST